MDKTQSAAMLRQLEAQSIRLAASSDGSYEDWESSRDAVLELGAETLRALPDWVIECRTGSAFWDYIKSVASGQGSWRERRVFIRRSLSAAFRLAEQANDTHLTLAVQDLASTCSSRAVLDAWQRISDRRSNDPEGSITAARSMLESVCKYILDQRDNRYTEKEDLPRLYRQVAKELRLAPEQHQEEVFRQIFGGCSSVIAGFASLRNKLGDAHGKGSSAVRPGARHADLAINLAGSISLFLVETHDQSIRVPDD